MQKKTSIKFIRPSWLAWRQRQPWQPSAAGLSTKSWHVWGQRSSSPCGIWCFAGCYGSCSRRVSGRWRSWRWRGSSSWRACCGWPACGWSRQGPSCQRMVRRRRSCRGRGRCIWTSCGRRRCLAPIKVAKIEIKNFSFIENWKMSLKRAEQNFVLQFLIEFPLGQHSIDSDRYYQKWIFNSNEKNALFSSRVKQHHEKLVVENKTYIQW